MQERRTWFLVGLFLTTLVTEGRLRINEAEELAHDLAYKLAKQGYNL